MKKFSSANLQCSVSVTANPKKYIGLVSEQFTAVSECVLTRKSTVVLDFEGLGLELNAGTQYTVEIGDDVVLDPESGYNNLVQNLQFTTPATVPALVSFDPNTLETTNNTRITLTYNRNVRRGSTGSFRLYSDTSTLVYTFGPSDNKVTVSGVNFYLNVTGLLKANTTYHVKYDGEAVRDVYGIKAANVTTNIISFKTAQSDVENSFGNYFHDFRALPNAAVTMLSTARRVGFEDRYLAAAEFDFAYVEDTTNALLGNPTITDFHGVDGDYYLTISPSTTSYAGTTNPFNSTYTSGVTVNYNTSTKVLTLIGTRDDVNNYLDGLTYKPPVDYTSNFSLTYSVTTPEGNVMAKTQNMVLGTPYDPEVTNMIGFNRSYYGNKANYIFETNTPFISDFDTTAGNVYKVTLRSPIGAGTYGVFSSYADDNDANTTWTFTGTRAQCNERLSQVRFLPNKDLNQNITFVYGQYKNNVLQLSVTQNLTSNGLATITPEVIVFTYDTPTTWTPTFTQKRYCIMDLILIGAGGGGASPGSQYNHGGGGGGGGVLEVQNIAIPTSSMSPVIGLGGLGSAGSSGDGVDGSNTYYSSYTAYGGQGGNAGYFGGSQGGSSGAPTTHSSVSSAGSGGAGAVQDTTGSTGGLGIQFSQLPSTPLEYNKYYYGSGGGGGNSGLGGGTVDLSGNPLYNSVSSGGNAKGNGAFGCGGGGGNTTGNGGNGGNGIGFVIVHY